MTTDEALAAALRLASAPTPSWFRHVKTCPRIGAISPGWRRYSACFSISKSVPSATLADVSRLIKPVHPTLKAATFACGPVDLHNYGGGSACEAVGRASGVPVALDILLPPPGAVGRSDSKAWLRLAVLGSDRLSCDGSGFCVVG